MLVVMPIFLAFLQFWVGVLVKVFELMRLQLVFGGEAKRVLVHVGGT